MENARSILSRRLKREKHLEKKEETDYYIGDHCSIDHFGRCGSTKKSQ